MKIISTLCFIILGLTVFSQNLLNDSIPIPSRKVNTVYAEGFGTGMFYSVNYDRLLTPKNKFPVSASIGLGMIGDPYSFGFTTPVSFQGLIGKNNHYFEVGLALVPYFSFFKVSSVLHYDKQDENGNYYNVKGKTTTTENRFYLAASPKIGYRYQRANGGFFGRITFSPFFWIS